MALSEKQFQQQVEDLCQWLGLRYYHTHDSRRSVGGFPDLVIVGTRTIFAELKSHKGRVAHTQAEWINDLRKSGQEAYLWRPDDFDRIRSLLVELAGRKQRREAS